jgi:hypothetical protein
MVTWDKKKRSRVWYFSPLIVFTRQAVRCGTNGEGNGIPTISKTRLLWQDERDLSMLDICCETREPGYLL